MPIAGTIVVIGAAYAGVGLVFAAAFVTVGAGRIDPSARRAPVGFRLLILPGTVALWPLLALHWMRGLPLPVERTAHRDAVRPGESA